MNLNLFIAKKIGGKSGIACFSVAISLSIILISIAVTNGFKHEINLRSTGFSGEYVLSAPGVPPNTDKYPINKDLSFINKIDSINGIKNIEGVAYTSGIIKTNEDVQGLLFKGVDSLYNLEFYKKSLVKGELPNFSGNKYSRDILMSSRLADMLNYKVGDKVLAYFIDDNIRVRSFKISGLFNSQLGDVDKSMVIIDLRQVQRLNGWKDNQVSSLEINIDRREANHHIAFGVRDKRISKAIEEILYKYTKDDDSSVVLKYIGQIYPNLYDWLGLMNLNVLVILILMLIVAGFNMISGLLIILFQKISMIGLLKSIGMHTRSIIKIFITKGAIIVVKGMLYGNIVAAILCFLQWRFQLIKLNPINYFVDSVPIYITLGQIILLNVISFLVMILIMIIPSNFISNVSPDKTMRVE